MIQLSFKSIMTSIILLFFSLINFSPLQGGNESNNKLIVVYPKPNQVISDQNGYCLVLGRVDKKINSLYINDEKVNVDQNGSFLHYTRVIYPEINDSLYLSSGKLIQGYFEFRFISDKTIDTFLLPVNLNKPLRTLLEDNLRIDDNFSVEPGEDLLLKAGEILEIKFKATPNCTGYFMIDGESEKYPLTETYITNQYYLGEAVFGNGFKLSKDTVKGIYVGHLIVPDKPWKNKEIKIVLEHNLLNKKEFKLQSRISVNQEKFLKIVKILKEQNLVIGRTGPMLGYNLFLPEGVKAVFDGESKGFYKLKLTSNQSIYVPKTSVKFLPDGTILPKSTVEVIRTTDEKDFVRVEIGLKEKLPYKIKQNENPLSIKLNIYNAISNIDWIYYDRSQNLITNITWNQVNDEELEINIALNQKHLWGYSIGYEENILVLKVKKTPKIQKRFLFFGSPLKGIKVVLDPGHNADDGAVGPSGLKEKDINLVLAKITKEVLEEEGAKVFLTREDNPLPLRERYSKVISFEPDFSISIHNNAVPDGVNPLEHNGFSVYYYNPNARDFALILHEKLKENLSLPDFGMYWDNLYMCRIPETISILVEPTFIIHPEQERLLIDKDFQLKIARSIKEALIEFLEKVRE